ncbi:MAG: cytochrome b5 domain-containing protein [Patescibacteria group bacterium]
MNSKLVIGIVAVVVVVGAIVMFYKSSNMSSSPAVQQPRETMEKGENEMSETAETEASESAGSMNNAVTNTPQTTTTGKSYTLADISNHSKAEDCYMAIEGKVYDMTPYIQKQLHPGGAAILFGCGKDSTAIFNLRPKDNRPHSQKARNQLENYYIGELAK